MAATIYHSLTMTTPDDTRYENKPGDWNKEHLMTLSAAGSEIVGAFSNANGLQSTGGKSLPFNSPLS